MEEVSASVGRGGINQEDDVERIQILLNRQISRMPGEAVLAEDGKCGDKTIHLIEVYQREVVGMTSPDGRIDPGGRTLAELLSVTDQQLDVEDDWSGDSSQWSQEKKLKSMNPVFRKRVQQVLDKLVEAGYRPKIFYGWRSQQVQLDLYNQGRSKVKFSFHNATTAGGQPNAYAADIIDSRYGWNDSPETTQFWQALGAAAHEQDIFWGGDWVNFKDWAHVQMFDNHELQRIRDESQLPPE